jgi:hypothetical protein
VALPLWMASGNLIPGVGSWTEGLHWGRTILLLARRAEPAGFSQGSTCYGIQTSLAARRCRAGFTVAAYLVPQVMAYAEVAGLPPVTGLWAVMGPLFAYAVLGLSRQLSVGPESTRL